MKKFLGLILPVLFGGDQAMAQDQNAQQQAMQGLAAYGGSSGTQYMTYSSTPQLSADSDEVRLLLQLAADQGGSFSSYPSELSGAISAAEQAGWLSSYSPPSTAIKDKDGVVVGASSSGFVTWNLSPEGRKELGDRNGRLGSAATRMAHGTQYVPGAGVVVYGAARRVPLNQSLQIQDGGVVSR